LALFAPFQRYIIPRYDAMRPYQLDVVVTRHSKNSPLSEIALVLVRLDHNESAQRRASFLRSRAGDGYATRRECLRSGEIRILNSRGAVERTIPFSEAERKL
jgi:hypothetical protein